MTVEGVSLSDRLTVAATLGEAVTIDGADAALLTRVIRDVVAVERVLVDNTTAMLGSLAAPKRNRVIAAIKHLTTTLQEVGGIG